MALAAGEQLSGGQVRDADQRLVVAIESVGGGTPSLSSTPLTANALAGGAGTPVAGASAQLVAANGTRNGLSVTVDTAAGASTYVYLLLGAGTASAAAFHIALGAGGNWDGTVSGTLWRGAVQFFSAGTPKVGVAEV